MMRPGDWACPVPAAPCGHLSSHAPPSPRTYHAQGGDPGPAARLVNAAYSARIISNVTRSQSQGHGTGGRHHGRVSFSGGPGSGGGGSDGGGGGGGRTSLSGSGAATVGGLLGGLGQSQQRRPHAALQQLIGGLQARAAAAKAKQQQRQQLQSQSQPHQHQAGAAPQQSLGSGDSGEGRLIGNGTREGSAPPPPMLQETAGGALPPRPPGSFLQPQNRPRSPLLSSSLPQGGPGLGALAPTPTSAGAPVPPPGSLGAPASSSKSALAQMIVQAAGLSRISVGGEGGRNRLGAVQAALSGALSNPQLQEMLRKAKMGQMGGGTGAGAGVRGGVGAWGTVPDSGPAAAGGNGLGPGNGTAAGAATHQRPPPLAMPSEAGGCGLGTGMTPASASATASTGLFSPPPATGLGSATSTSTSGGAPLLGQTPGGAGSSGGPGSTRPAVALAPQQLLQIAAAVQKAVASGQAQPPHVQQQLANLRAFIARHLAATPAGSPQHSMLTQLQAMLAGAGQQPGAAAAQDDGGAAAPVPAPEPSQQQQQQQQPGEEEGGGAPAVGSCGLVVVDGMAAVTRTDAGGGKGTDGGVPQAGDASDATEPLAKRQRQEA